VDDIFYAALFVYQLYFFVAGEMQFQEKNILVLKTKGERR